MEEEVARAARALREQGFVVLRGRSLYSDEDLQEAQAAAQAELQRVKAKVSSVGLLDRAPWTPYSATSIDDDPEFKFQEALSYSRGRLDMPLLMGTPPFHQAPWRNHPDLLRIGELFMGEACEQTVLGSLWNFPVSERAYWHRDGTATMLVVVTAAADYPERVGFIHLQPHTQAGGVENASNSRSPPKLASGETAAARAVLRRGETLIFTYTTKHAATPNHTDIDRCLFYSIYGPVGHRDEHNHKESYPSLFSLEGQDVAQLDSYYDVADELSQLEGMVGEYDISDLGALLAEDDTSLDDASLADLKAWLREAEGDED